MKPFISTCSLFMSIQFLTMYVTSGLFLYTILQQDVQKVLDYLPECLKKFSK